MTFLFHFLLNFTESFFIMKHYDSNMLKAFEFLSQLVDFQLSSSHPHCWHAALQMERETELWKEEGIDGEVIVHSQGAVGK